MVPARPGPAPACTDGELLAIAVVRHLLGRRSEAGFLAEVARDWGHLFPVLPHQSEASRRAARAMSRGSACSQSSDSGSSSHATRSRSARSPERQRAAPNCIWRRRLPVLFTRDGAGHLIAVPDFMPMSSLQRPWWQMTRTVRQGFWGGSFFLVYGAISLAGFPSGGGLIELARLMAGVPMVIVGPAYLASAIALRRRQRRTYDPAAGHPEIPRL